MAKKPLETVQTEVAASLAAAKPDEAVAVETQGYSMQDVVLVSVERKECGTCTKHWRKLHGVPSWGECMLVAKARPSPELTTDKSGCSAWGKA